MNKFGSTKRNESKQQKISEPSVHPYMPREETPDGNAIWSETLTCLTLELEQGMTQLIE